MVKSTTGDSISPPRPLRLLVVEDNPADAELAVAVLERAGYQLSLDVVHSPIHFQQQLEQNDYDIILSAHHLAAWTGMQALEIVKASAKGVPFVVLTAALGDGAALEYIKQGAADYILKQDLERLPAVVVRLLREKAHQEEAARLREVIISGKREWELTFDTVPDPVLLMDQDCLIRRANRAAAKLLGLQFSEMIGRPCCEVVHGRASAPSECPHRRDLETGNEERGDTEEPRLGKTFDATASPVRDPGGGLRGCVLVLRDVTERKRAEKARNQLQDERDRLLERLQLQIERMPDAYLVTDANLRCTAWNPAAEKIFGYSKEEVLGKHPFDAIVPPSSQAYMKEVFERLLAGDASVYGTTVGENITKDGRLITCEWRNSPLLKPGGTFDGLLCMARDITARTKLEEQLRQAQKMEAVGRLAGGVAHDFNNLLTIISGYSQMLLSRFAPGDTVREQVQEIKKAGERAGALTRQLLAFSRRQVLAPQVLDLNAVVANVGKMVGRLIGEDIELVTSPGAGLGRVRADPSQIEQVIMNLAVNSRDAMPEGGKLILETADVEVDEAFARSHIPMRAGRYVLLSVKDTGCGMDTEVQAHLFEPFFTTKEVGKGTGLGLVTVYGIVKQSGGYIWVYSGVGQGTTFKIYLPRLEEVAEAVAPTTALVHPVTGWESVLLVEDEDSVRSLVQGVLKSNGYKVLEARRGEEALKIAKRYGGPIQLLLTDVIMPRMSGRELAKRLAAERPEMKVLYMSGHTDSAIVHHGVLDSGVSFLQKPFTPEILARKVREVLDQ